MKSILYSALVGSLALALATGGAQAAKDNRSQRAKPQQRSASVHAARPANTGRSMSANAHRNPAGAGRQTSAARAKAARPAVNPARAGQASATRAKAARPASRTQ